MIKLLMEYSIPLLIFAMILYLWALYKAFRFLIQQDKEMPDNDRS
jgi:hypothetical protein